MTQRFEPSELAALEKILTMFDEGASICQDAQRYLDDELREASRDVAVGLYLVEQWHMEFATRADLVAAGRDVREHVMDLYYNTGPHE